MVITVLKPFKVKSFLSCQVGWRLGAFFPPRSVLDQVANCFLHNHLYSQRSANKHSNITLSLPSRRSLSWELTSIYFYFILIWWEWTQAYENGVFLLPFDSSVFVCVLPAALLSYFCPAGDKAICLLERSTSALLEAGSINIICLSVPLTIIPPFSREIASEKRSHWQWRLKHRFPLPGRIMDLCCCAS